MSQGLGTALARTAHKKNQLRTPDRRIAFNARARVDSDRWENRLDWEIVWNDDFPGGCKSFSPRAEETSVRLIIAI